MGPKPRRPTRDETIDDYAAANSTASATLGQGQHSWMRSPGSSYACPVPACQKHHARPDLLDRHVGETLDQAHQTLLRCPANACGRYISGLNALIDHVVRNNEIGHRVLHFCKCPGCGKDLRLSDLRRHMSIDSLHCHVTDRDVHRHLQQLSSTIDITDGLKLRDEPKGSPTDTRPQQSLQMNTELPPQQTRSLYQDHQTPAQESPSTSAITPPTDASDMPYPQPVSSTSWLPTSTPTNPLFSMPRSRPMSASPLTTMQSSSMSPALINRPARPQGSHPFPSPVSVQSHVNAPPAPRSAPLPTNTQRPRHIAIRCPNSGPDEQRPQQTMSPMATFSPRTSTAPMTNVDVSAVIQFVHVYENSVRPSKLLLAEHLRCRLLCDAASAQDHTYLTLHQVACVREYDPNLIFRQLDRSIPVESVRIFNQLLSSQHEVRPSFKKHWATFPHDVAQWAGHGPFRSSLSAAVDLLDGLPSSFRQLTQVCRTRDWPPTAREIIQYIHTMSVTLIKMVHISVMTSIWTDCGQSILLQAQVLFQRDYEENVQMQAQGSSLPGHSRLSFEEIGRQYKAIYESRNRRPNAAQQSAVRTGHTSRAPIMEPQRHIPHPQSTPESTNMPQTRQLQQDVRAHIPLASRGRGHSRVEASTAGRARLEQHRGPTQQSQVPLPRHLVAESAIPLREPRSHEGSANSRPIFDHETQQQPLRNTPNTLSQLRSDPRPSDPRTYPIGGTPHIANYPSVPIATLFPRPGVMGQQVAPPDPDTFALHQAYLRSPILKPVPLDDENKGSIYQYIDGFVMAPQTLRVQDMMRQCRFELSPVRHASRITIEPQWNSDRSDFRLQTNPPTITPQEGQNAYRLRCNYGAAPSDDSLSTWAVAETAWPDGLYFELNGKRLEPRRKLHFGRNIPLDITHLLQLGTNTISILSLIACADPPLQPQASDVQYSLAVESVTFSSHATITAAVHARTTSPSETVNAIRTSLMPQDDDIACLSTTIPIRLTDSILATKVWTIPVRSAACRHREAFDLATYLETRLPPLKKDTEASGGQNRVSRVDLWECPVCGADARPDVLRVDGWLVGVREALEVRGELEDAKCIEVDENGNWELRREDKGAKQKRGGRDGSKDAGEQMPRENGNAEGDGEVPTKIREVVMLDDDDDD